LKEQKCDPLKICRGKEKSGGKLMVGFCQGVLKKRLKGGHKRPKKPARTNTVGTVPAKRKKKVQF